MTGYVRRKLYQLCFGDRDLDGLEVTMKTCSVEIMLEVRSLRAAHLRTLDVANAEMLRVIDLLTEHLVTWNLQDEAGVDVPATADGVRRQDRELLAEILGAWQDAVEGVAIPLRKPSPSGETLVAVSIPMETLSGSPAS